MLLPIVPETDIIYYKSKQVGQSTSKATKVDYLHHTYIYDIVPRLELIVSYIQELLNPLWPGLPTRGCHYTSEAISPIMEVYGLDGGQRRTKIMFHVSQSSSPILECHIWQQNGYVMIIASVRTNLCRRLFGSKTSAIKVERDGMGIHRLAITISIHQLPQGGCALDLEENLTSILHHPNLN